MLPTILIIAAIFAFLIDRLAFAVLKNKLRVHAGDYGADPHTAALAEKLEFFVHDGSK